MVCSLPESALAADSDTISIDVTGVYGQSDARSMLAMINEFRSSDEAWYWNEDDTTKTVCTGLKAYTYDYQLEAIAMQRAMELAISFSHTRPDGRTCWTAYSDASFSSYSYAENIAYGYAEPENTFKQWREDDDNYLNQGHRRNMLSSDYQYIGIGHVYVHGRDYWVQEFSRNGSGDADPGVNDVKTTVPVSVKKSSGTLTLSAEKDKIEVEKTSTVSIPEVDGSFKIGNYTYPTSVTNEDYSVYIEDIDIADIIDGGRIQGYKAGSTNLVIENLVDTSAADVKVPIDVTPISIKNASINLTSETYTYTSLPIEPSISSVVVNAQIISKEYNSETEEYEYPYDIEYTDNIDAGTATITVTAKEDSDYKDSVSTTFEIEPAAIDEDNITAVWGDTSFVYDGTAQKPNPLIEYSDDSETVIILQKNIDYTLQYSNNINAGEAVMKLTGKGNFSGIVNCTFNINALDISKIANINLTAPENGYMYTGNPVIPDNIEVTIPAEGDTGDIILVEGKDYDVTYENNIEVSTNDSENEEDSMTGKAVVTVVGKGNYTGSLEASYIIEPRKLLAGDVTLDFEAFTYSGKQCKPDVSVSIEGFDPDDYAVEVTYPEASVIPGEYVLTVTATGAVSGSVEKNYTIKRKQIIDDDIVLNGFKASIPYVGEIAEQEISLVWGSYTLVEDTDYKVTYANNDDLGQASIRIDGINNFSGMIFKTFNIGQNDISDYSVKLSDYEYIYTGEKIIPEYVIVTDEEDNELERGTDYTFVAVNDNVNVGTVILQIVGIGNYGGIIETEYDIVPAPADSFDMDIKDPEYTGEALLPEVIITREGSDNAMDVDTYDIVIDNPDGLYNTVNVVGDTNEYKNIPFHIESSNISNDGQLSGTFIIKPHTIKVEEISFEPEYAVFTGSEIDFPDIIVSVNNSETILSKGIDFDYSFDEVLIKNAGYYNVNVYSLTGDNNYNYTGSVNKKFEVKGKSLNIDSYRISSNEDSYIYSGSSIEPVVQIMDYKRTGTGEFPSDGYDGVAYTMVKGKDYNVSYENNIDAGTAVIKLEGIGNYTDFTTKEFEILPIEEDYTDYSLSFINDGYVYTGEPIEIDEISIYDDNDNIVSWVEGEDYELIYEDNINAGIAKVTVSRIGNYKGKITASFGIDKADIEDCDSNISSEVVYNGLNTRPTIKLSLNDKALEEDYDYIVELESPDGKDIGVHNYEITGIGNFDGIIAGEYTVTKANLSANNIKIYSLPDNTETYSFEYTGQNYILDEDFKIVITGLLENEDLDSDDYEISISPEEILNTGTYTVTVELNDQCEKYTGQFEKNFKIAGVDIEKEGYVIEISNEKLNYNGKAQHPNNITVKLPDDNTAVLQEGVDYELSYINNINSGEATVTATGINAYEGEIKAIFNIDKLDLEDDESGYTIASISAQSYTGQKVEPRVVVRNGDIVLPDTEYLVGYSNNINVGTANVSVTGKGDNVIGALQTTFEIKEASVTPDPDPTPTPTPDPTPTPTPDPTPTPTPDPSSKVNIENASINLAQTSYVFTGQPIEPIVTVILGDTILKKDTDYNVSYSNNVQVGKALITVEGIGDYTGTVTESFDIIAQNNYGTTTENQGGTITNNTTNNNTSNNSSNSNAASNNSATGANASVTPEIGDKIVVSSGSYIVTSDKKEVQYVPVNKKANNITIPATITSDNITYNVTSIKANAFKGNTKLKKVTIGKNVKSIGAKAFYGCTNLQVINIKTTKLTSSSVGSKAFKKAGSKNYKKLLVKVPKSKKKAYKSILIKKGLSKKSKIR